MAPNQRFLRILITALLIVIAQITIVLLARGDNPLSSYKALYQWDSEHYDNIATNGYLSDIKRTSNLDIMAAGAVTTKTNVAFFPAYPYVVRLLHTLTSLSTKMLLLIVAQMFAVTFWVYFLLLLDLFTISRWGRALCVGVLMAHPASFFLVAGYSESLFMTMLLGYVYWSNREGAKARTIAAIHGITMTLTRIHGIFASAYPLFLQLSKKTRSSSALRTAAFITCVSMLGLIGFLAYCEIAFGHWDLYLQSQWHGWGIVARYAFLFQGYLEPFIIADIKEWMLPGNVGETLTTLTFWLFVIAGLAEFFLRRKTSGWRTRAPLWITAFVLWYFYTASLAEVGMRSMLRYLIAPHALMILAYAHLFRHSPKPVLALRCFLYIIAITAVSISAFIAWRYMQFFTDGIWVA